MILYLKGEGADALLHQPFVTQIGVGRVIKGWDEGVPQLSLGQKANLICTPDFAYGMLLLPLRRDTVE